MKWLISILVTGIVSFLAGLYLPWWSIAIIAFLVALFIHQKPLSSFFSGFLGVFLLWIILSSFINAANGDILAERIAGMFGLGTNRTLLIIITGLVGGLVAGFAALTASYLRKERH